MKIALSPTTKKLVLPFRLDLANLLPDAQRMGNHLVVNHGADETKLLRNMGLDAPPPILSQYDWAGTTPFESQRVTAAMFTMNSRAYCLSSMGVGKTRAALYAYDYLRGDRSSKALKALVVAPLSTLVDVWEREIFESFHHLNCAVIHGSREKRLIGLNLDVDIYIINPDGLKVIGKELMEKQFGIVVIDELAEYRNPSTDKWKAMNALINAPTRKPIVWGLTGSPTPNGPTDAYGQIKLMTPRAAPRSFRSFRQQTETQVSPFKWVPRPEANDIVAAAMKPSVRFSLDECHDLPPITYSMRHADLSATQARMYKAMLLHFKAEYKGAQITAANEGVKLMKLLQISAGFAYTQDRGMHTDAKNRLKLVLDLIENADKKVLVFASFKWMVHALAMVIGSRHSVAEITGDTPKGERDRAFAAFRTQDMPHVIAAHAGCMAHGLNLTQADTIIWYGPAPSSNIYEQANARVRRPGQTCKTHIIHIESTPIERKVFARLQNNQRLQGVLLSLFEGAEDD